MKYDKMKERVVFLTVVRGSRVCIYSAKFVCPGLYFKSMVNLQLEIPVMYVDIELEKSRLFHLNSKQAPSTVGLLSVIPYEDYSDTSGLELRKADRRFPKELPRRRSASTPQSPEHLPLHLPVRRHSPASNVPSTLCIPSASIHPSTLPSRRSPARKPPFHIPTLSLPAYASPRLNTPHTNPAGHDAHPELHPPPASPPHPPPLPTPTPHPMAPLLSRLAIRPLLPSPPRPRPNPPPSPPTLLPLPPTAP